MSGLGGGVVLLLSVGAALSSCPSADWLPITDGECYLPLVPPYTRMKAEEAVQTCRFFGTTVTLPQVFNHAGQERVHLLTGGNSAWLGLRRADLHSPWLWPGGYPLGYTHWGYRQPSDTEEHCVAMDADGFWFNVQCHSPSYFTICYCESV